MKRLQSFFTVLFLLVPCLSISYAETQPQVLFHPFDQTLKAIAAVLEEAQESIDIAMYSMDVSDANPVMAVLKSDALQSKIRNKTLKIRMVFEGYGTVDENTARSQALEDVGVDVRWMRGGKKVHHKFAVVDSGSQNPVVVSGSANWSLSSQRSYDENIMFWPQMPNLSASYQNEFNLLWSLSDEFGVAQVDDIQLPAARTSEDESVSVVFNTANYKVKNGKLTRSSDLPGWSITRALVSAIDSANHKIDIATTRIVLRPVFNAIVRAAERGVKIQIVVNQDQYESFAYRKSKTLEDCADEYDDTCSKDQNFPWFLDNEIYPGKENVSVRIKFFSLALSTTLAKQMHSKYLIVDGKTVLSGSFNWSFSSEWNHIENLVSFEGDRYPEILGAFVSNQRMVYGQGRTGYTSYNNRIDDALRTGVKTDCSFAPMALTFAEIDWLLDTRSRRNRNLKDACL